MFKFTKNHIIVLSAVAVLVVIYLMFFRKPKAVVVIKKTDDAPKSESSFDAKGGQVSNSKSQYQKCVETFLMDIKSTPTTTVSGRQYYDGPFLDTRINALKSCAGY